MDAKIPAESIWIGLLQVVPLPGNEMFTNPKSKGGYTNGAAYARDQSEFRQKVLRTLHDYGLGFVALNDVKRLDDLSDRTALEPRLLEAIGHLSVDEDARFGTLFCYDGE